MVDLSGLVGLTGKGGDIAAKVDFLRDVLPDYIEEGYSYSSALADLRANGFSIANSLASSVRRQIYGIEASAVAVRQFPDAYFPTDLDLAPNPDRQDKKYKFVYSVDVLDEDGEIAYTQNFSIQTDNFGSIADLKARGEQYLSEIYPAAADEEHRVRLSYGLKKTR